jgi:hypothetical protein
MIPSGTSSVALPQRGMLVTVAFFTYGENCRTPITLVREAERSTSSRYRRTTAPVPLDCPDHQPPSALTHLGISLCFHFASDSRFGAISDPRFLRE